MPNTLSFCIFDDLSPRSGPITIEYDENDKDALSAALDKIVKPYLEGESIDPSEYYFTKDYDKNDVLNDLMKDKYYVWNRYEKYYVIAFAINYTRFEIFSKDCDKELIEWRENDEDDEIKGVITKEDYNENPVVSLMKRLSTN